MAVTEQTNTTLDAIAAALRERDGFAICGHVNPDGDCIGSQLTLAHALISLGKNVTCLFAQDAPRASTLAFLPGFDSIVPASSYTEAMDTFISVDVSNDDRIGDAASIRKDAGFRITIDHHKVDTCEADLNYVDPDASATALLIWRLIHAMGIAPDREMATCAYTGLMTDTGRFQYQNTDAESFEAAAAMVAAGADPARISEAVYQNRSLASISLERITLNHLSVDEEHRYALSWVSRDDMESVSAGRPDAETLIDTLRSIRGIRVACMLRGEQDVVRGSLRAKDSTDVARIARMYSGGGHTAAAGFTFHGSIDDAVDELNAVLKRELG